jgi:hypothetical protein
MKTLNVIHTAYRATLEEQDDTIVWLMHALRGAGAEVSVLLCGAAVNYALAGQDPSGLRFGALEQRHPPDLRGDIDKLVAKGVPVFVLADDLTPRGIRPEQLAPGLLLVPRGDLPLLFADHGRVWRW